MKKVRIMKTAGIAAAALFVVTGIFNSIAVAGSDTAVNNKRGGKTRTQPDTDGIEKRKESLKAYFLKAGISQNDVDGIFSSERIEVYHNIYPPPEQNDGVKKKKLSYFDEEFGLHKNESIESGKKLIADNKELFERIESLYGVPANYIVSIIRIETAFKEHLGKYGVFNALYTMSMLSKRAKRVKMANRELVVWVKLCKQWGMDPFDMKGSWAGAFGIPQFMPSSYRIFAVDDNGDGKIDLYDYPDTFASIANYLRRAGWKTGNDKKMRRAVYCYNREKAYVNAVFSYAEKI